MASTDVVMAGFGGQGLMAIGKILAKAAMEEGKQVTWMPSYGPEMRGGTANCCVIIDDNEIGSPVTRESQSAVVMNLQSIEKFEPLVVKGGTLVINSSLILRKAERNDLKVVYIPADEIAEKEGSQRSANMVMLGAYIGATETVKPETVEHAIEMNFASKKDVAELNVRIFRAGYNAAKK